MAVAAVLAGGSPDSAVAAGLGRLTVESGLGQPLNAVVEVTSLSRDELSSLTARLAAPEVFRRAGVEMSPALGALRFAVEERASGNPVVRITSEQPINEPFVDLLVELNWAAGRFVREYTFLLDPPELQFGRESVDGKTVMSQLATPVVASTAPVALPQRAQAPRGSAGDGLPVRGTQPASRGASRAAAFDRPVVAQAGTSTEAGQQSGLAAGQATPAEVTVQRGDTLAAIAERVKPADIAVEQAIISIYEANPRAFFGSVHQLRAGRTLNIPDRTAMESVDPVQARRQIRMQAADFKAYRERLAQATRKVDVAESGTSASGAVTARVDETGAPPATGDQLRLSRSAPGEGSDAAGSATGTQGGQVSAEALIASEAALREQTERVSLLEKNIADLQRLLELKNQQLAQMQLQAQLQSEAAQTGASATGATGTAAGATGAVAGAPGAIAGAGSTTAAEAADAAEAAGAAEAASAAAPASGQSAATAQAAASDTVVGDGAIAVGETASTAGASVAASTDARSPAAGDTSAGTSMSGESAAGSTASSTDKPMAGSDSPASTAGTDAAAPDGSAATTAAVAAASADPGPTPAPAAASGTQSAASSPASPAPAPAPVAEPSMVDQLLASPYTMPGLAAVLVALGGYGWYTMRRRRKSEAFEDSLLASDAFTANSLFGTTGGQAVDTNSPSMFGPSLTDTVSDPHSTEVDPIAEAEVYIAYGRESQAEEILREALKRQPERQAIRLKLLEICAGRKDAVAFGALAREMHEQTGGNNEEWPQVVTLGLALDPDNPLYSGAFGVSADADAQPSVAIGDESAATQDRDGEIAAFGSTDFDYADRDTPQQSAFDADDDLAVGVPPPIPQVETATRVDPFAETQAMGEKAAAGEPAAGEPAAGAPAAAEEPLLDFSLDVDTALGRAADPQSGTDERQADAADEPSDLERAIGDRFELPSLDFADFGPSTGDGQALEAPSFEAVAGEFASADAGARNDDATPSLGEPGDLRIELPSLDDLNLKADGGIAAIADEIGALDLSELDDLPPVEGGSPAWQEMATKLDLASAYEEIGDRDGARELLEEVVRGGDGDQKRQAQAMLASIG